MSRRGISLLETLVALATTAVVVAALHGALARAAAVRAQGTARAEQIGAARAALLRLGAELAAAVPADDPAAPERFAVTAPPPTGPAWGAVRFATAADDPRLLAYRVEPRAHGGGALTRRAASRFAPPDAPEPRGVPLVEDVRTFAVRCFDGEAWRADWSRPGLPRALALELVLVDGERLATTAVLPLGAGR